jgi:hypothetical protein
MKEKIDLIWELFDRAEQEQDEKTAEELKNEALALIASMPKNEIKIKTVRAQ